jgi:pimeloyl-CoA synthetase
MKNKIYHAVKTIQKSNIKMAERGNIDTLNIQIQNIKDVFILFFLVI